MRRRRNRNQDDDYDVNYDFESNGGPSNRQGRFLLASMSTVIFVVIAGIIFAFVAYNWCRIDVPAKHIAVLTRKTGIDMENGQEVALSPEHKGLQKP